MFVRKPKWELGIQSSADIWQKEPVMEHDRKGRMSILLCVVRIHHKLHAADFLRFKPPDTRGDTREATRNHLDVVGLK